LRSLVLLSTAYRQEMVSQLPSAIHKHLHPEYYVGGYLAATRRVTPIDIALPLLEIYVTHEFWDRAVLLQRAWGHLREISLSRDPRAAVWLEVQECTHIPEDVKEESMPSGPVVFASVEHGLVDCFIEGRVDDYVSVLLLLQNREADVIDTRNLVSQARSHEGGERVLAAAAALNRLAENDRLFDLSPLDTPDFVPQPILKASRNAWNTIKGG